ncbi:DUF6541 family protein [uncultured Microbacterium sp.]|uniref:DUF6541 family protein n=1 Tax=uncultured Microbacterium sp. TaxID=191216 RepID=UPI0028E38E50|nr:DUF6541 family protein [uncultured Microbacterium sp.]
MSAWLAQAPALLVALAVLVLPGLPVGLCLRGVGAVVRLGVSIAVSLGVVAAASVVAPVIGLPWGPLPVVLVAAVVSAIGIGLRVAGRGAGDDRARTDPQPWIWISLAAAFLGWLVILALGMRDPGNPSQLYDGLFHLNAVEFIASTGDASPLHMTMATPSQETSFYPTLWHALVSLIVPVSGGVVTATNTTTMAVVALIWPVVLATLTAVVFPQRPQAARWAPVLGFGFSIFPLGFLNWGVLYPNLLGTLLVPILIASVLLAFAADLGWGRRTLRILVALAATAATALAHPSALLGAIALLVPFLLSRAWRTAARGRRGTRITVGAVVVLGLVALVLVWIEANVTTHEWLPTQTVAQSLGEVAFLSPVDRSTGFLLGPLAAIGIWRVVKDRRWWILGGYAVSIALYVIAAWLPVLAVRSFFVGVWYDDTTRVAALLAMWGLPLAALGAAWVWDALEALGRSGRRRLLIGIVVVIAVAAATHMLALRNDLRFMRDVSFRFDDASQGLSPDEAALFERIDDEIPEDAVVVGDPLTGAGLLFAYTGQDVVFPHVTGNYGADAAVLARQLADGTPAVCEAAERLGVTHAVDFGETVLFQNHYTTYDGLHDLDRSPILTEVDRVGDAVLYEITGCD